MSTKYIIISLREKCLNELFKFCHCSDVSHSLESAEEQSKPCRTPREIIIDEVSAAFAIVHRTLAAGNVAARLRLQPGIRASEKFVEWYKSGHLQGQEIDVAEIAMESIEVSAYGSRFVGLRC